MTAWLKHDITNWETRSQQVFVYLLKIQALTRKLSISVDGCLTMCSVLWTGVVRMCNKTKIGQTGKTGAPDAKREAPNGPSIGKQRLPHHPGGGRLP